MIVGSFVGRPLKSLFYTFFPFVSSWARRRCIKGRSRCRDSLVGLTPPLTSMCMWVWILIMHQLSTHDIRSVVLGYAVGNSHSLSLLKGNQRFEASFWLTSEECKILKKEKNCNFDDWCDLKINKEWFTTHFDASGLLSVCVCVCVNLEVNFNLGQLWAEQEPCTATQMQSCSEETAEG